MSINFYKFTIIFLTILFLPLGAGAAALYLEPEEGVYGPGDSVSLNVMLDIDDACVNTVEAEIVYPKEFLRATEFLVGESILTLWLDRPDTAAVSEANKTGVLRFAGGIPGGYCGKIPGDPGQSNIVGRLIFTLPGLVVSEARPEMLEVGFSGRTRVLLNDGLGTADRLRTSGAALTYAGSRTRPGEKWRDQISADTIPPEPFIVELQSRPDMFNGRYYIIFSTLDKQSGLDRYEVLEIRPEEELGLEPEYGIWERLLVERRPAPEWKIAQIPYLLEDQSLQSVIKVKAIDKAGNERIAEYRPPAPSSVQPKTTISKQGWLILGLAAILFIGFIIFSAILIRIFIKRRRKNYEEEKIKNQR